MIMKYNRSLFKEGRTKRLFLLFMVFASLLATSSMLSYIIFFPDKTIEVTLGNTLKKNVERESVVKGFITKSKKLVYAIGGSETFKAYLDTKGTSDKEAVESLIFDFLQSHDELMQIQYIDNHAKEEINVKKLSLKSPPVILHKHTKDQKTVKENFAISQGKPLGKIWFSSIGLYKKDGHLQTPFVPILRAFLPIEKDGEFGGVVVATYFMDSFLQKLLYMPLYDRILLDGKGYPLIHYKKGKDWAYYKKDRYNISQEFPNSADKILSQKSYKGINFTSRRFDVPIDGGLVMILKLKDSYVNNVNSQELSKYIALFCITFFFSIIFGILVVKKFSDILNSLKRKNYALIKELYYDSLTDLKNRRSLIDDIESLRAKSLILIDIQSFSEINDLYGEKTGDILLQKFSQFLREKTTKFSLQVYRLHGNTFALLCDQYRHKYEITSFIDEFIGELNAYDFSYRYDGNLFEFVINVKIGVSTSKKSLALVENADMALNHAKKTNKDYIIYDTSLGIKNNYENDIEIIKMIKKALDEGNIIPYFQPIYKKSGASYESLMRLKLDDGRVLTPYHFLEIAKKTRFYFDMTYTMIEKTFKIFEKLPYDFSINLTYLDIKRPDTLIYIKSMLQKYNVADRLIVEVVESDTFIDYDITVKFLEALKEIGIRIAVDDFGSGYSNFAHLIKLAPYYVKIDGSLIKDMDTNEKSFAVVKTIVSFAKSVGIHVVAEYIHSKSVYEKAKSLDIDGYQGFYLGKPQDANEVFDEKTQNTPEV